MHGFFFLVYLYIIWGYLSVLWRTGRRADELRRNISRGC